MPHPITDIEGLSPGLVMAAGDWHANLAWARRAVELAAEAGAGAIVHLGDFGYWPRLRGGPEYLDGLEQALAYYDLPLWWLPGNHEDHEELELLDYGPTSVARITDHIGVLARGARWQWFGQTWCAVGGAYSISRPNLTPGVNWFSQEVLTAAQAKAVMAGGPADVLLCHDAPDNVPALDTHLDGPSRWREEDLRTSENHRALIGHLVDALAPKHLLHGHHHWAYQDTRTHRTGSTVVQGLNCDGYSFEENLELLVLPL